MLVLKQLFSFKFSPHCLINKMLANMSQFVSKKSMFSDKASLHLAF